MTIAEYGGAWSYHSTAGIVFRYLWDSSSQASTNAASSNISKLIIYYTDAHDVDEDKRTMTNYGGFWPRGNDVGMMHRDLYQSPDYDPGTVGDVASKKNNIPPPI